MFSNVDNGAVTVALDKNDCTEKVKLLLSDTDTYCPRSFKSLNIVIEKLKELLKRWKLIKFLDPKTYHSLFMASANLPCSYALPKIHKPEIPFRFIMARLHNLASFLYSIFSKRLKEEPKHSITYSFQLLESMKALKVPNDLILFSLDDVALFTSIPNNLVMTSFTSRWHLFQQHTIIAFKEMPNGLNLILRCAYFSYNKEVYHQRNGSPMGSPLSPLFDEIVIFSA